MSAYIQFFIRNDETFLPIGAYCRSSAIYQAFDEYIPWEKVRAISEPLLRKVYGFVVDDIQHHKEQIEKIKEHRTFIATFNNTLEEKMEMLENVESMLYEYEEGLDDLEHVKNYIHFLEDIIESVEYETHINENAYLYAGIEVGNPTIEDILL